jgi:malate dehydrogenase (oxaloacetate-decarboxylating)(NADP+)
VVPDDFFLAAARTLSHMVSDEDLHRGSLYPGLKNIRKISLAIAQDVCKKAYAMKIARRKRPVNIRQTLLQFMYNP